VEVLRRAVMPANGGRQGIEAYPRADGIAHDVFAGRLTVAASLLAASACSNALSPDDPTDIGAWMELYHVPGVSVAVIRDFEVAHVEVHGVKSLTTMEPVTGQTLFQAASISKSVTAMGVMSLVQDGTVSLDRNVND
jgi:CubicO group peptidase (beta-lactamase class C family)